MNTGGCKEAGWKEWEGLQRCAYCGSITVEDAIKVLMTPGTHFSGSDWKYGFPHKFYLEIPNPNSAKLEYVGSQSGPEIDGKHPDDRWQCRAHPTRGDQLGQHASCSCPREKELGYWIRITFGHRERLHCKFYTKHLTLVEPDLVLKFDFVAQPVFGIRWFFDAQHGLMWQAPRCRQWYGEITANGVPDFSQMQGTHR